MEYFYASPTYQELLQTWNGTLETLKNSSGYTFDVTLTNVWIIADQIYCADEHNYTDCKFTNESLNNDAKYMATTLVCPFFVALRVFLFCIASEFVIVQSELHSYPEDGQFTAGRVHLQPHDR